MNYANAHPETKLRLIFSLLLFFAGLIAFACVAFGEAWASSAVRFDPSFMIKAQNLLQVRIEQRVIIRVPLRQVTAVSNSPNGKKPAPIKYKEEKVGKCLMMDRLVGSRPGPKDSLELVTRDGILIRAYLNDGCLGREFYAGAYMERPADGKLCVERDLLYARTGAKCEINKFRLLTPV
jgi:hypothetical protein